jgi:ABC-type transport system involved in cytochrome c biogenesis permease subunit
MALVDLYWTSNQVAQAKRLGASAMNKTIWLAVLSVALWLGAMPSAGAQDPHAGLNMPSATSSGHNAMELKRNFEWDQAAVDAFGQLPVQDLGRVKPMEIYGGLRMLMLNGKRKLELPSGEVQKPGRWTMDVIFFPEAARGTRFIRIENDGVLSTVGLDTGDHRKRDWYAYNELLPARALIAQRAQAISMKERADQSPVERQLLKLGQDLDNLESMLGMLDPLRVNFDLSASPVLMELFESDTLRNVVDILDHQAAIAELMANPDPALDADKDLLRAGFMAIENSRVSGGWGPGLVPPIPGIQDSEAWWRVRDLVDLAMLDFGNTQFDVSDAVAVLRLLDQAETAKMDQVAFVGATEALQEKMLALAAQTDVPLHIEKEVFLYRFAPFIKALVLFLIGTLVLLLSTLIKDTKLTTAISWGLGLLAFGLLTYGIVMRCLIRERPPIITLYDTILFVTAVAVLACLITEWILRMRVALGAGLVLGVVGMFLASSYEAVEIASAGDTMSTVVAVLDTNYYLAIHVTTIAMGYSGGLLAAAIAHVWLLGRFFRFKEGDVKFYKGISRMVYGTLCFSLFFSLFGTVMGGIWANDSWGRFWGWDPKENGALLICLWLLLTLHLRMGGFIRDRGLSAMAIGCGAVVAASWWGVNLLNVGLHSYGFTSGVAKFLYLFWGSQLLVLILSLGDYMGRKDQPKSA